MDPKINCLPPPPEKVHTHTSRGGGLVYEWSNLNCIAILMSSRSIDFLFACPEHNFASSSTSVKYPTTVCS